MAWFLWVLIGLAVVALLLFAVSRQLRKMQKTAETIEAEDHPDGA